MTTPETREIKWPHEVQFTTCHTDLVEVPRPGIYPERGSYVEPPFNREKVSNPERRSIDVLCLGGNNFPTRRLNERGIRLAGITALQQSDTRHGGYGNKMSRKAFQLLIDATPEKHDAVTIDTEVVDHFHAIWYADALTAEMKERTIVYSQISPNYKTPSSDYYGSDKKILGYWQEVGITNVFLATRGQEPWRAKNPDDTLGLNLDGENYVDFFEGIINRFPAVNRPDRTDLRIFTQWPGSGGEPGFEPPSRYYDIG
jgi:hypothetical protein